MGLWQDGGNIDKHGLEGGRQRDGRPQLLESDEERGTEWRTGHNQ